MTLASDEPQFIEVCGGPWDGGFARIEAGDEPWQICVVNGGYYELNVPGAMYVWRSDDEHDEPVDESSAAFRFDTADDAFRVIAEKAKIVRSEWAQSLSDYRERRKRRNHPSTYND